MKEENELFNKIRQKVAKASGMPKEIVLSLPLITMIGNTEITIENFKGIVEYSNDVIRVNTGCGIFRIDGKKLFLKQITSEIINVSGVIKHMEFM